MFARLKSKTLFLKLWEGFHNMYVTLEHYLLMTISSSVFVKHDLKTNGFVPICVLF